MALSTTHGERPGTTVTGTYNGNDDVAGNASASINITSAAPFAASGTLTMHGPTVTPMASAQPYLAGTPPPYANALYVNVNGSDPQIWYTAANSGSTCLANYDIASANGACATASPGPAGLSTDGSTVRVRRRRDRAVLLPIQYARFPRASQFVQYLLRIGQRFGLLADDELALLRG